MRRFTLISLLILLACSLGPALAAPPVPEPKSKCQVCGMFVQRHPDWLATLEPATGEPLFFCGPKDLFKFLHFPQRYRPQINREEAKGLHVKDYYSLQTIDGRKAFYVTGSDVRGPMGAELIPFAHRNEAEGFLQDHDGKKVLSFDLIGPPLLQELE